MFYRFLFLEKAVCGRKSKQRIPDSVVEELGALLDIFELLSANIIQQLAPHIYLSDAYKTGGVQYDELSPRDVWMFKDNIAETRKG